MVICVVLVDRFQVSLEVGRVGREGVLDIIVNQFV